MPRITRAAARAQEFQIVQDMVNNAERGSYPPKDTVTASPAALTPALGELNTNAINLSDAVGGDAMGDKQSMSASKGKRFKKALKEIFTSNTESQKEKDRDDRDNDQDQVTSPPAAPAQDKYWVPSSRDSAVGMPEHTPIFAQYASNSLPGSAESLCRSSPAKSLESVQAETTPSVKQPECFELPAEPLADSATSSLALIETSKRESDLNNANDSALVSPLTPTQSSCTGSIKTWSPNKQIDTSEGRTLPTTADSVTPLDSPERMQSKSPPRIEDSVDEIDALEDALEQVARQIPNISDRDLESPIKFKQDLRDNPAAFSQNESDAPSRHRRISPASSFTSNGKNTTKSTPRKADKESTKPALTFSTSPVRSNSRSKSATSNKPRQSLSTSRPGFVPARSTKPPTRPSFTLPGDAMSAKLKAQREDRLKREAEAEAERRRFKARPVPRSSMSASMPVRENVASKARQSLITNPDELSKENDPPQLSGRPTSSDLNVKKRANSNVTSSTLSRSSSTVRSSGSNNRPRPLSTIVRTTSKENHPPKNRSASDNRPTTSSTSSSNPAPSAVIVPPSAATGKATVTKSDIIAQRAKAREIYGRDKIIKEEMEAAKREKEEAAKKARAEAAERSRQASREWAEKQRLKKVAASTSMTIGVSG